MDVKFWGTRGSIPVPGGSTLKYGGNTPCIQITSLQGNIVIVDGGTGIRELGNWLLKDKERYKIINILISHTHFDHIQGLPFFAPFYDDNFEINIYVPIGYTERPEEIIDSQMQSFFFPVTRDVLKAKVNYYSIWEKSRIDIAGMEIQTSRVNHSQGTLSFKLRENDKSLVYMTDNEIMFEELSSDPEINKILHLNQEVISFCANSDYLIHDCMYNQESFPDKLGWGHSNNVSLAYFAMIAGVKNLILFHYDPDYSDSMVEEMLLETKEILLNSGSQISCLSAFEGLIIDC